MMEPEEVLVWAGVDILNHVAECSRILCRSSATSLDGTVEAHAFGIGTVIIYALPVCSLSRIILPRLRTIVVSLGKDMVEAEWHHVVNYSFTAHEEDVLHGLASLVVLAYVLAYPFVGNSLAREVGVPSQTTESVPVSLCHGVATEIGIVAHVCHTCYGTILVALEVVGIVGVFLNIVEELLPHRSEETDVVAVSEVFLSNLKLCHLLCLRHSAKEWAVWLTWLEVDRTVLNLDNHVIHKLAVQILELYVSLLCTVWVAWTIDERTPHDYSAKWLECLGKHVRSVGMSATEVHRSRLSLAVSLYEETTEVRYLGINLFCFLCPPLLYVLVEWVGSLQSVKDDRT